MANWLGLVLFLKNLTYFVASKVKYLQNVSNFIKSIVTITFNQRLEHAIGIGIGIGRYPNCSDGSES